MTKEDAIHILIDLISPNDDSEEAVDMAISAIEMQPLIEKFQELDDAEKLARLLAMVVEPCEDTISRADAIRISSGFCHWSNIPKELEKLPSVTPRTNCQFRHENGNCLKVGGFCTSVDDKHCPLFCNDAISREDALKCFEELHQTETLAVGSRTGNLTPALFSD